MFLGILALCFSLVHAHLGENDTSALFDGDYHSSWRAPSREYSFFVEPNGCFDTIRLLSSADNDRHVAGMMIHKEENGRFVLLAKRSFHCPGEAEQEFRLREEICQTSLRFTFGSCTNSAYELRELSFDFSSAAKEKRQAFRGTQVGGITCTTTAQCSAMYVSYVTCDITQSKCVVPECIVDADCPDPKFPVCNYFDLNQATPAPFLANTAGIPRCSTTCKTDSQCAHIPRYPYCVAGECAAENCRYNTDCLDPRFPVCVRAAGQKPRCSAACATADDCTQYFAESFCVTQDPDGNTPACTPETGACTIGQCIKPACNTQYDCTDPAAASCAQNSPNVGTLGQPYCAPCTAHQNCDHFPGSFGARGKDYCYEAAGAGSGLCIVPDCLDNLDCVLTKGVNTPVCNVKIRNVAFGALPSTATLPTCQACVGNDDCALFDTTKQCIAPVAGGTVCATPECLSSLDCSMDPTTPVCKPDMTTGLLTCQTGCNNDDDCAQFLAFSHCKKISGSCVGRTTGNCIGNEDCLPSAPICLTTSGDPNQWNCQALCTKDDDCAQYNYFTIPTTPTADSNQGPVYRCFTTVDAKKGQCLPTCTENWHCTDPNFPVCKPGSVLSGSISERYCVSGCTGDQDCAHFTVTTTCKGNVCIPPPCQANSDCTDVNNPRCNRMTHKCEGCMSSDDCYHFVDTTFCAGPQCEVPLCRVDRDCTHPANPKCNWLTAGPGVRPSCTNACDPDSCAHFIKHKFCNTGTGQCETPQCITNEDCNFDTANSRCDTTTNTCVPCQVHNDCAQFSSQFNFCATAGMNQGCVQPGCLTNEDCNGNMGVKPVCDFYFQYTQAAPQQPQCVSSCNDPTIVPNIASAGPHVGCAAFTLHTWCGTTTGNCVVPGCYDNNDCINAMKPRCNIDAPSTMVGVTDAIPTCDLCVSNDDCAHFSDTIICSNTNVCVTQGCFDNSDCPASAPLCLLGTLDPVCTNKCTNDNDCAQYLIETYCVHTVAALTYYPNADGQCVQPLCRDDNDCPATAPVCTDNDPTVAPYNPRCAAICTNHDDCARFTNTYKRIQSPLFCNPATMQCEPPACIINAQCTDPTASVCNYVTGDKKTFPACVGCTIDQDCAQFSNRDKCLPPLTGAGASVCREPLCRTFVDCTDPMNPICDPKLFSCVPGCTSDDDCAQFFDRLCTGGVCVLQTGAIVAECFENYDCLHAASNSPLGSKPVCQLAPMAVNNKCAPICTNNDDCYYYALEIWCVLDKYARAGTVLTGQCINPDCLGNEDCPAATPVCTFQEPSDFVNYNLPSGTHIVPTPTCQALCVTNDDCSQYAYEVECNGATGVCQVPQCFDNDDCPASAPICTITPLPPKGGNVPNKCTATCTSNNDCTRFAANIWCSIEAATMGTCITPACITNYDCPMPNYPTCQVADPTRNPYCTNLCVDKRMPNIHNDDCTRFVNEVWCTLRGSCEVPGCKHDRDCTLPTKPVCDLTQDPPKCNNVCTNNDQCNHFKEEVICVSVMTDMSISNLWGTCIVPQCTRNTDCKNPSLPTCNLGLNPPKCDATCVNDDDCVHLGTNLIPYVCITNPDKSYDPIRGTCVLTVCYENEMCLDPTTPICDQTQNPPACIPGCKSDDDCTQFAKETYCNTVSGVCGPPECLTDADCVGSANGPACLVGSRRCVGCIFDEHCASSPATPACYTSTNTCVQCVDDLACTKIGLKSCVVSQRVCVQCVTNLDCAAPTPSCDTFTGLCVQCQDDSDCTGSLRACDIPTNSCVQCNNNVHCQSVPGLPACELASRTCVTCTDDSQCSGGSRCDVTNRKCVTCTSDADCPGRACLSGLQSCVDCTLDSHCTNPSLPACDVNTNTCVQCTSSTHCLASGAARCDVNDHVCQECVSDSDCGSASAPACDPVSGTCTQCFTDSHCAGIAATPACDVPNRKCVACTTNTHCSTGACDVAKQVCVDCMVSADCHDPAFAVCNVATHSCVTCLADIHCTKKSAPVCQYKSSAPTCVQCLSDSQCGSDYVCNAETNMCVECNTAADCWLKNPYKPICNAKGGCQKCDEDIVCAELFMAYQACHTGTGACVADSYAKGFYVAAIVLGTVATFFVIIAVVAVIAR